MKYVVYRSPEGPRISIFAAPTTHKEDADAHPTWTPRSAGFVEFLGAGEVRAFGFSESLRIGCDPRDASLIEVMMSATLASCVQLPAG
jgi:hypothetical protein